MVQPQDDEWRTSVGRQVLLFLARGGRRATRTRNDGTLVPDAFAVLI